jgi:hypothetical protein
MGLIDSILGDLGVGSSAATGGNSGYSFDQQQKDFIKLQFKYALILKQKLAAGKISQAYYDANFWLTTQQLDAPYTGWWTEFKTAIDSEDLNWLAKQTGETVDALTGYLGDALRSVASSAGALVGTAISSSAGGLASGFFGSLDLVGWAVIAGVGFAIYWGYKNGYVAKVIKKTADAALL